MLRKIYGPQNVRVTGQCGQINRNIINIIKTVRMRWLGHVVRVQDNRVSEAVVDGLPGGRRRNVRSRARWQDDVRDNLKRLEFLSGEDGLRIVEN